jgi:hypothetical protein
MILHMHVMPTQTQAAVNVALMADISNAVPSAMRLSGSQQPCTGLCAARAAATSA